MLFFACSVDSGVSTVNGQVIPGRIDNEYTKAYN